MSLIKRWGRGNIHACLQMWRKETDEKKQHALWAPADVVMTRYAQKRQRRHPSESSSEDEDLLSPQSSQGDVDNNGEQPLVYSHTYIKKHTHTHTHTHTRKHTQTDRHTL